MACDVSPVAMFFNICTIGLLIVKHSCTTHQITPGPIDLSMQLYAFKEIIAIVIIMPRRRLLCFDWKMKKIVNFYRVTRPVKNRIESRLDQHNRFELNQIEILMRR